ncbi:hypothetical protein Tco_0588624 [Tanacetum coccineum]
MFYKKNIDYVYLLWEDFLFQIEYKDAKKTNKMSYPRFTKIIIDYFMSKDQSISKRNKMFWHTARDDTMFTSMRCISRHEYTQTPVQATKGTRIKSKAKVAKSDMKKQPTKKKKAKGSHASGSGDGVDTQSKVPDEQHLEKTSADEGTGTIPGVPDIPMYESESEKESWDDSEDEDNENNSDDISDEGDDDDNEGNDDDDDDANDDDKQEGDDTNDDDEETDSDRTESDRIKIPILDQSTTEYYEEEERFDDEETMNDDEDDEVTKEFYEDVNVNLEYEGTEMTNAWSLRTTKCFSRIKLLNLENPSPADNKIASLMETSAHHVMAVPENTSGFIPPPPPFFNPLIQQATPTLTPTTSKATTLFPLLLDFSSVLRFNDRVTNLEKDLSKIKQVDQFCKSCDRENVTELIEVVVLTRSSSQPTSTYEAAASLSEFELTKILIDKMEKNKSYDKVDYKKKLCDALVESYNTDKDLFDSYGEIFSLKRSRDERDKDQDPSVGSDRGTKRRKLKEPSHIVEDSGMQQDQEFITGNNDDQPADKEVKYDQHAYLGTSHWGPKLQSFYGYASNLTLSKDVYSKRRIIALYTFKKGDFKRLRLQDIEDMLLLLVQQKLTNLTIDERYGLNVTLRMYTRRIVIQRRVVDLQLGIESYQKKLNLTKPDTYRSNLRNKTAYTSYLDPHGIIYVDQYKRKRLMRADELHKFSDGMLNDVRIALHDIVVGIRMEYLPMRKWSNLDTKRAWVMVQDIDKQLYQRRFLQNLEKFIGGREYGNDLRLPDRTI